MANALLAQDHAATETLVSFDSEGRAHLFVRVTDRPELGASVWRAPDGTIWGDLVTLEGSGEMRSMPRDTTVRRGRSVLGATEYCAARNATLPSNDDFIRLRSYLLIHS